MVAMAGPSRKDSAIAMDQHAKVFDKANQNYDRRPSQSHEKERFKRMYA
jgi:hypothetical protein